MLLLPVSGAIITTVAMTTIGSIDATKLQLLQSYSYQTQDTIAFLLPTLTPPTTTATAIMIANTASCWCHSFCCLQPQLLLATATTVFAFATTAAS
jgi:hypothetical protein